MFYAGDFGRPELPAPRRAARTPLAGIPTLGGMTQTWDDALRASGYRVTPHRQLVLEAVTRLEHATPEEIFTDVRHTARGINVSTVYRTLELLEQIGLVTHTHLGHGAPSYHLAAEAQHVHLVCRQ